MDKFEFLHRAGSSDVVVIPRYLIRMLDRDHCAALLLARLLFWTPKARNKDGWIYKTYEDWDSELFLSHYQVRRAKAKLERMGLVETKVKKAYGNPTVHYRVLPDPIIQLFECTNFEETNLRIPQKRSCENDTLEPAKSAETLTGVTTEKTSSNTSLHKVRVNFKGTEFSVISNAVVEEAFRQYGEDKVIYVAEVLAFQFRKGYRAKKNVEGLFRHCVVNEIQPPEGFKRPHYACDAADIVPEHGIDNSHKPEGYLTHEQVRAFLSQQSWYGEAATTENSVDIGEEEPSQE